MLEEGPSNVLGKIYKPEAPIYLKSFRRKDDGTYEAVCTFPPNPRIDDTHVGIAEMMVALSQASYCIVGDDIQRNQGAYRGDDAAVFSESMKQQAIGKLNVKFKEMLYPNEDASLTLQILQIRKHASLRLIRIGLEGFMKGTVDCVLSDEAPKPKHA